MDNKTKELHQFKEKELSQDSILSFLNLFIDAIKANEIKVVYFEEKAQHKENNTRIIIDCESTLGHKRS